MSEKDLYNKKNKDDSISQSDEYVKVNDRYKYLDLKIYNELDDFASEVLIGEEFLKYVKARREYLFEPEETVKKYLGEEYLEGKNNQGKVEVFTDFYYRYLAKYSNSYLYEFMSKGFTDGFRKLLNKNGINPDNLDIDWDGIRSKELEYDESLVDILYSIINYELEHRGYGIFGINMGYESVLYFIVSEKTFLRINNEPELFTIFDIGFLETIYSEIYEVTGNLGVKNVRIGDFLEKRGNEYYTLFMDKSKNVAIENIDENDESQVKIIL